MLILGTTKPCIEMTQIVLLPFHGLLTPLFFSLQYYVYLLVEDYFMHLTKWAVVYKSLGHNKCATKVLFCFWCEINEMLLPLDTKFVELTS